eukprot:686050-Pyramimonas_sp.AAC.1
MRSGLDIERSGAAARMARADHAHYVPSHSEEGRHQGQGHRARLHVGAHVVAHQRTACARLV